MLIERVYYVFMEVATFLISALAFFVISFFVEGVWNYYVPVSLVILSFWIISINSQFKSIAKGYSLTPLTHPD